MSYFRSSLISMSTYCCPAAGAITTVGRLWLTSVPMVNLQLNEISHAQKRADCVQEGMSTIYDSMDAESMTEALF